jgi:hypothetical protein
LASVTSRSLALLCLTTAAVQLATGCGKDVTIGFDFPDGGAGTGGIDGSAAASGAPGECEPALCLKVEYECGDCIDNDADGLTDAEDPECLGPCDNTENSFTLGVESGATQCREDCAFDRDSGSGNDGCYSSHVCDQESVGPEYPPTGQAACEYAPDSMVPGTNATCAELRASQSDMCRDYCLPLTPNGCDCFGCCELPARSDRWVWVGGALDQGIGCSLELLGDESACRPCTPVPSCLNECEACEVCAGNAPPSDMCESGEIECPVGRSTCGPNLPPCSQGYYCITGCCVPEPQ